MKNRRNIVEQKYPPENSNDLWLKDDVLYKATPKGWVPLSESPSISESYENNESSLKYKGSDNKEHLIITDNTFSTILANKSLIEVKWTELKDLRDNSELIPGSLYRITDYQCTTTQTDTRSAGHQFDIVLLALSENKLAEEGWAMMHDNIYDVTFDDGVTKKCYLYKASLNDGSYDIVDIETKLGVNVGPEEFTVNEENNTITTEDWSSTELIDEDITYNYFQNSNLSAWKVWYCLDNDKSRFAWADAGSEYIEISVSGENKGKFYRSQSDDTTLTIGGGTYNLYAWKNPDLNSDNIYYTWQTDSPIEDTVLRNAQGAQYSQDFTRIVKCAYKGRGVIYRLIDEWNNDCPYDFKNIQLYLPIVNGEYDTNGQKIWVYTFCSYNKDGGTYEDGSLKIIEVVVDGTYNIFCNNVIVAYLQVNRYFVIPFNVLLGYYSTQDEESYSPIDCEFFYCYDAIVQHTSNVYLYNCIYKDYVVKAPGIYYYSKRVLTES